MSNSKISKGILECQKMLICSDKMMNHTSKKSDPKLQLVQLGDDISTTLVYS